MGGISFGDWLSEHIDQSQSSEESKLKRKIADATWWRRYNF
jgi:hypothetical protein